MKNYEEYENLSELVIDSVNSAKQIIGELLEGVMEAELGKQVMEKVKPYCGEWTLEVSRMLMLSEGF